MPSRVRSLKAWQTNESGLVDDDTLFGDEVEGEDNPFVMGGFTDMFGEDFLGLRELGITSELGVSTLSVPKKLLRPKGARMNAGSSIPYVEQLLGFYLLPHSSIALLSATQKQANGTSATFPTATSVYSTRVDKDGRRGHRTLATFLQISFRRSCAVTSCSSQTSTPRSGWGYNNRTSFDISIGTNHPRAAVTATSSFSNAITTKRTTAYAASITTSPRPSRRRANLGPN